jgi:hypothetical protein
VGAFVKPLVDADGYPQGAGVTRELAWYALEAQRGAVQ